MLNLDFYQLFYMSITPVLFVGMLVEL